MEERNGQGVRMSDVAGAAGVSRQAVYDHFGSRADLMVATVRHGDEALGLDERLRRYRAATGGTERLGAFVEFWGNYVPEIHGIAMALLAARETDEAVAAAWDDRMGVVYEACPTSQSGSIETGRWPPGGLLKRPPTCSGPCSRSAAG
jgi:AcrR family transcriptional regulator